GRTEASVPFMVLEYLEGEDLGARATRIGAFELAEAVEFVGQACEGVAEAHAAGIVHRDLKPQNLFLTYAFDGRPIVKVLDFGVSKLVESSGEHPITSTNDLLGTPDFMSPEQLMGARDVDARSDVWALGVILYRLVTGRAPFSG